MEKNASSMEKKERMQEVEAGQQYESNHHLAHQENPQGKSNRGKARSASVALLLSVVLSISLIGCGTKQEPTKGKESASPSSTVAAVKETPKAVDKKGKQTTYPLTVKDASGTEITFDKAPERVTTISASETEVLFALGAGDKVFGVDKYSNYPLEAKSKAQVGDMNTNLEALIATKPDVVFAGFSTNRKVIDKLRELKIKVYAGEPKTIDQVIEKIETIGNIMNLQDNAQKVTDTMRAEKKKIVDLLANAPKKKVYLEFDPGWTVGDGEFLSELVALAGGTNVAGGKKGWYKIDPEAIIKANPEVILYTKPDPGQISVLDEINKRTGWDKIDAMKNKQVFGLEMDPLVRVGPRITQGLLSVAKAVHPELVK